MMSDVTDDSHDTQLCSSSRQQATIQRLEVVIAQISTHTHTLTRDLCGNVKVTQGHSIVTYPYRGREATTLWD